MFRNLTDLVRHLIIINVIVYFGTVALPAVYKSLGSLYFYESEMFRPFQFVTSMFLHGDIMHLAFNMMSLYFLGPWVERVLGPKRFFILYFASGIGASLVHLGFHAYEYYSLIDRIPAESLQLVMDNGREVLLSGKNYADPLLGALNRVLHVGALGASGCVYGVMIAFASMFPDTKMILFPIPIPIKMKYLALAAVVFGLVSGVGGFQQGVAHFAHLGGALTGFILVYIWKLIKLR